MMSDKERVMMLETQMRELKTDLKDCVNELCYQCGQYRHEHEGACDGCRWKPLRHRDWSASE